MKGKYALIKLKPTPRYPGEKNWLLFKKEMTPYKPPIPAPPSGFKDPSAPTINT